jgi:hypothetical protein
MILSVHWAASSHIYAFHTYGVLWVMTLNSLVLLGFNGSQDIDRKKRKMANATKRSTAIQVLHQKVDLSQ